MMELDSTTEIAFIRASLETLMQIPEATTVPLRIVAEWVAKNWPVSPDADPEVMTLLEEWEWHLGAQGSSVPAWLSQYDGLPSIIAGAAHGLEIVRTENIVSFLVDKHSEAIYLSTGFGPQNLREAFAFSLESTLSQRNFASIAYMTCVTFDSFTQALEAERSRGDNSYSLMSHLHLSQTYLQRITNHILVAKLAAPE